MHKCVENINFRDNPKLGDGNEADLTDPKKLMDILEITPN